MPKTRYAYLRYLVIHSQVKRNAYREGYPTLKDLMECLEEQGFKVSESTVEKDLRFLRDERGAPLVYDRTDHCYRYTEEWEFDVPFSHEDVRFLRMTLHKLEIFGDAQEFKQVKDSIDRLVDYYNLAEQHAADRTDKYILFEYTKGFRGKNLLSKIYDAIHDEYEISFTHCRFDSDKSTQRTIQPYILKEHRNRWYVLGVENNRPRIFGLDRISDLEVTETRFIRDPEFYDGIFRVFHDAVGVFAFGFETEDVILHFSNDKAPYIKTLPLHQSQTPVYENEPEGYTVRLHVKVTEEFINECILPYGDNVKIISPPGLAERVMKIWQNAINLNK